MPFSITIIFDAQNNVKPEIIFLAKNINGFWFAAVSPIGKKFRFRIFRIPSRNLNQTTREILTKRDARQKMLHRK